MADRVPAGLTAGQARHFGFTVGIAFALLGALLWWRDKPTVATIAASLAGFLILGGIVMPKMLIPVERFWMAFARQISKVTTPIIMGIVYFLVLTPIALVVRLSGQNPLTPKESGGSFWILRTVDAERRGGMNRQF